MNVLKTEFLIQIALVQTELLMMVLNFVLFVMKNVTLVLILLITV